MAQNTKVDVYELVTNRIIEQMEKGIIPWQKPWHGVSGGAISYTTGKPYSLLNQFLLGKEGEYLTFNQVQTLGGKVKKGAKAQMVVFFKQYPINEQVLNEDGEMETKTHYIPLLRHYMVFHIDDCKGIKSKIDNVQVVPPSPIESAENVVRNYFSRETCHLLIKESNSAFYSPVLDEVVVPKIEQYTHAEEYYSTLFHEMTHSTGAKKRLDRNLEEGHFGNDPYAKEELVAEIGSAFLSNTCGLDSNKAFKNSVAYIQSWSNRFKQDKKLIVWAAGRAQKAAEYILNGTKE